MKKTLKEKMMFLAGLIIGIFSFIFLYSIFVGVIEYGEQYDVDTYGTFLPYVLFLLFGTSVGMVTYAFYVNQTMLASSIKNGKKVTIIFTTVDQLVAHSLVPTMVKIDLGERLVYLSKMDFAEKADIAINKTYIMADGKLHEINNN